MSSSPEEDNESGVTFDIPITSSTSSIINNNDNSNNSSPINSPAPDADSPSELENVKTDHEILIDPKTEAEEVKNEEEQVEDKGDDENILIINDEEEEVKKEEVENELTNNIHPNPSPSRASSESEADALSPAKCALSPDEPVLKEKPGGRLKFFKDGVLCLELSHRDDGDKSKWIQIKQIKSYPTVVQISKEATIPAHISTSSAVFNSPSNSQMRLESSTSHSLSDDASSSLSSPRLRDCTWKQPVPQKGISFGLEFFMHPAPCVFAIRKNIIKERKIHYFKKPVKIIKIFSNFLNEDEDNNEEKQSSLLKRLYNCTCEQNKNINDNANIELQKTEKNREDNEEVEEEEEKMEDKITTIKVCESGDSKMIVKTNIIAKKSQLSLMKITDKLLISATEINIIRQENNTRNLSSSPTTTITATTNNSNKKKTNQHLTSSLSLSSITNGRKRALKEFDKGSTTPYLDESSPRPKKRSPNNNNNFVERTILSVPEIHSIRKNFNSSNNEFSSSQSDFMNNSKQGSSFSNNNNNSRHKYSSSNSSKKSSRIVSPTNYNSSSSINSVNSSILNNRNSLSVGAKFSLSSSATKNPMQTLSSSSSSQQQNSHELEKNAYFSPNNFKIKSAISNGSHSSNSSTKSPSTSPLSLLTLSNSKELTLQQQQQLIHQRTMSNAISYTINSLLGNANANNNDLHHNSNAKSNRNNAEPSSSSSYNQHSSSSHLYNSDSLLKPDYNKYIKKKGSSSSSSSKRMMNEVNNKSSSGDLKNSLGQDQNSFLRHLLDTSPYPTKNKSDRSAIITKHSNKQSSNNNISNSNSNVNQSSRNNSSNNNNNLSNSSSSNNNNNNNSDNIKNLHKKSNSKNLATNLPSSSTSNNNSNSNKNLQQQQQQQDLQATLSSASYLNLLKASMDPSAMAAAAALQYGSLFSSPFMNPHAAAAALFGSGLANSNANSLLGNPFQINNALNMSHGLWPGGIPPQALALPFQSQFGTNFLETLSNFQRSSSSSDLATLNNLQDRASGHSNNNNNNNNNNSRKSEISGQAKVRESQSIDSDAPLNLCCKKPRSK